MTMFFERIDTALIDVESPALVKLPAWSPEHLP